MCCDSCPGYEECSINEELKDKCCTKCPDYDTCYGGSSEDHNDFDEWDKDNN